MSPAYRALLFSALFFTFHTGQAHGQTRLDYRRQEELAGQYFKEDEKCRRLMDGRKWKEAEEPCRALVLIADRLSDDRALERMIAYELFGHVLRWQKRHREALKYYHRAHDAVRATIKETDAELGRLYGDMAITHQALGDLDKAREMYRKSAQTFRLAIATIGDEWLAQQYRNSLKKILEFHLTAAEQAGAAAEVEEVKKMLRSIP